MLLRSVRDSFDFERNSRNRPTGGRAREGEKERKRTTEPSPPLRHLRLPHPVSFFPVPCPHPVISSLAVGSAVWFHKEGSRTRFQNLPSVRRAFPWRPTMHLVQVDPSKGKTAAKRRQSVTRTTGGCIGVAAGAGATVVCVYVCLTVCVSPERLSKTPLSFSSSPSSLCPPGEKKSASATSKERVAVPALPPQTEV